MHITHHGQCFRFMVRFLWRFPTCIIEIKQVPNSWVEYIWKNVVMKTCCRPYVINQKHIALEGSSSSRKRTSLGNGAYDIVTARLRVQLPTKPALNERKSWRRLCFTGVIPCLTGEWWFGYSRDNPLLIALTLWGGHRTFHSTCILEVRNLLAGATSVEFITA